jgi:glutathione S-transferase
MLLVGVNRSPFTRRVAITLNIYGIPFEQRELSGFGNRDEVRAWPPFA